MKEKQRRCTIKKNRLLTAVFILLLGYLPLPSLPSECGGQETREGCWPNGNRTRRHEVKKNAKGNDVLQEYLPNGKLKYRQEVKKDAEGNDVLHGKYMRWYENGQKAEKGEYRDGEKHGRWIGYHENGQKHFDVGYKDVQKHGRWIQYSENGQKRYQYKYWHGTLHERDWKQWNKVGKRWRADDFD